MLVNDLVHYVSQLLNDQEIGNEFYTWDEPLVNRAVVEAVGAVARIAPHAFIVSGTQELVPGSVQPLPPERRELFVVDAQLCGTGAFVTRNTAIYKASPDSFTTSGSCPPCAGRDPFGCTGDTDPCGNWKLTRWSWIQERPHEFMVSPPVPNDGAVRLLDVSWSGPLVTDGATPLSDKWQSAVVAFALHRLYGVDIESQLYQTKARDYLEEFKALMGA